MIKIECLDWDRVGSNEFIGEVLVTLSDLLRVEAQFILINSGKIGSKQGPNSGILEVIESRTERSYSYIDYLQHGTAIKLMIAIDFTGSNGDYTLPSSLHYSNSSIQNEYQRAIEAVGKIMETYDPQRQFSVYGFGGKPD